MGTAGAAPAWLPAARRAAHSSAKCHRRAARASEGENQALFEANDATYGYRRIHAALVRGGESASAELVCQLMRVLGLVACRPRS